MKTLEDARAWLNESHKDRENGWKFREFGMDIAVAATPALVTATFTADGGTATIEVQLYEASEDFSVGVSFPSAQMSPDFAEDFAMRMALVAKYGARLQVFMDS